MDGLNTVVKERATGERETRPRTQKSAADSSQALVFKRELRRVDPEAVVLNFFSSETWGLLSSDTDLA